MPQECKPECTKKGVREEHDMTASNFNSPIDLHEISQSACNPKYGMDSQVALHRLETDRDRGPNPRKSSARQAWFASQSVVIVCLGNAKKLQT
jgi:hypothetical protein